MRAVGAGATVERPAAAAAAAGLAGDPRSPSSSLLHAPPPLPLIPPPPLKPSSSSSTSLPPPTLPPATAGLGDRRCRRAEASCPVAGVGAAGEKLMRPRKRAVRPRAVAATPPPTPSPSPSLPLTPPLSLRLTEAFVRLLLLSGAAGHAGDRLLDRTSPLLSLSALCCDSDDTRAAAALLAERRSPDRAGVTDLDSRRLRRSPGVTLLPSPSLSLSLPPPLPSSL